MLLWTNFLTSHYSQWRSSQYSLWRLGNGLLSGISGWDGSFYVWCTVLTRSSLTAVEASGAHSQVGTEACLNTGVFSVRNFFPCLKLSGQLEWSGTGRQGLSKVSCDKETGGGSKVTVVANLSTLWWVVQHAFSMQTHIHTHIYTHINK